MIIATLPPRGGDNSFNSYEKLQKNDKRKSKTHALSMSLGKIFVIQYKQPESK